MSNEDVAMTRTAAVADTQHAGGSSDPMSPSPGRGGPDLADGTLLDEVYRVIRRLGGGAMGTVYLVEHQQLGRRFAAKVVAPAHSTDVEMIARLRNEARVASSIQHENIVDVTHLGRTSDGALFVVMELLEGCDLRHRLVEQEAKSPTRWLPDDEARRIARDVLVGLQAAHDGGIVHRDLKPDNIFLSMESGKERAKLVDFGISKGARGAESDMRLTRTGQIIGTPLYMAPEQARGTERVDARSDIYAIGVILYELTTGRLPFEATSIYELIVKHATELPPNARTHRLDLPEAVEQVVMRCLEKSPDDRYQSAKATLEAWEKAWQGVAPSVPPPSMRPVTKPGAAPTAPSSNGVRWIGAGVIALALAGVLVVSFGGGSAPLTTVVGPPTSVTAAPTTVAGPPPSTLGVRADIPVDAHRIITSEPAGATVEVDDTVIGTTPLELTLARGAPTEITVRLAGRRPVTQTITGSDPDTVSITLERAAGRPHPPSTGLPTLAPH